MKPWIFDAQSLEVSEDLADFSRALLYTNGELDSFLADNNRERLLVAAPKGFGKTLMLKAKRLAIAKHGHIALPQGMLVDKPAGPPPIFSAAEVEGLSGDPTFWPRVWQCAIILTILVHMKAPLPPLAAKLGVDGVTLRSACDWLGRLLRVGRREQFELRALLGDHLVPLYKEVHRPLSLFIDNVDEYLDVHLTPDVSGSAVGVLDPSVWYEAQWGLGGAIRQLHSINPHVKVYASIRLEVVRWAQSRGGPDMLQRLGSLLQLHYTRDDLAEIARRNIAAEPPGNLFPTATTLEERFFGPHNATLTNPCTGEEEPALSYLLRHTLGRPRDVAVLGRAVSDIAPNRRGPTQVIDAINRAARDIVQAYIAECAPHVYGCETADLLPLIDSNVLGADDLLGIATSLAGAEEALEMFAALQAIGLLGRVETNYVTSQLEQVFNQPGEAPVGVPPKLPSSEAYLIHPAADTLVIAANPAYRDGMDRLNIVGHGRPWRVASDVRFVLQGDVVKASRFFEDHELTRLFVQAFKRACDAAQALVSHCEMAQGDSVTLADASPHNVLRAAAVIAKELARPGIEAEIRFGGDAGTLDISAGVLSGRAFRRAKRLEPYAVPASALVTGEFHRFMALFGSVPEGSVRLTPAERPLMPVVNGRYNLAKNPHDVPTLVDLWELPLPSWP